MKNLLKYSLLLTFTLGMANVVTAQDGEIDAERLYKKSHDSDGSGKTPAGKKVHAKDYTKKSVQAEFTDEEAFKVIREGSKDEDGKDLMDPYPDYTDAEIKALIALVRSFATAE
jgi:cytochrome c551/c552